MIASRRTAGVVGLAIATLLASCGQPSAGNSVETENSIGMRTLAVDSVLPAWNPLLWGTVATLRFDRTNFDFSASTADGRDLRFERMDSTLLPFQVDVWDSAAGQGRVLVRLDPPMVLPWSSIRMIWGLHQASLSNPAAVWAGLPDSVGLLANSVKIDDFEDGNTYTSLPSSAAWRMGSSTVYSVPTMQIVDVGGGGRANKAMHVAYSTASPNYTVVAVSLASGPRNLRSLDSIVFSARGSGKIHVALEHLTNSAGPKAWMQFNLESSWTRKAIRPVDFDTTISVLENSYGWTTIRDSVTDLSFIVENGTDLWLDDIRFFGVNRDDLR